MAEIRPVATGNTAAEKVATDQSNNQPNDSGDVIFDEIV
jgi:hypothetical protein